MTVVALVALAFKLDDDVDTAEDDDDVDVVDDVDDEAASDAAALLSSARPPPNSSTLSSASSPAAAKRFDSTDTEVIVARLITGARASRTTSLFSMTNALQAEIMRSIFRCACRHAKHTKHTRDAHIVSAFLSVFA